MSAVGNVCWAEAGWLILMGRHLISAGKVTLRDGRQVDELIVGTCAGRTTHKWMS